MKNIVDVLSLQNRQQENKLQKVKPTDYRYLNKNIQKMYLNDF